LSQKSSALSILFEGGETLAIYDPTDIVAKNHNLFVKVKKDWKRGGREGKVRDH
jgi:hypothetical protein